VTPIVTLCAALAFLPALAGAQAAIDFRGVPLGATEAEFISQLPGFHCRQPFPGTEHLADRICIPNTYEDRRSFGGAETATLFATFMADRMTGVSATFKENEFDKVRSALDEKFGVPASVERPDFQTRGGLKAKNEIITWRRGKGIVVAHRFARSIDESSVNYIDENAMAAAQSRGKEAAKKNAKSL
jgi:hypothetical protein